MKNLLVILMMSMTLLFCSCGTGSNGETMPGTAHPVEDEIVDTDTGMDSMQTENRSEGAASQTTPVATTVPENTSASTAMSEEVLASTVGLRVRDDGTPENTNDETAAPGATTGSVETDAPRVTTAPKTTTAPKATTTPKATGTPKATAKSKTTARPKVTIKPRATTTPAPTTAPQDYSGSLFGEADTDF